QRRDMVANNGVPTDVDGKLLDNPDSLLVGASWNDFSMQSYDAIARLTHEFDDGGKVSAGVRYSNRNADFNYIFGGGPVQSNGDVVAKGLNGDLDQKTWSMDANYSRPFELWGQTSDAVVGADYRRYKTNQAMTRA